MSINFGDFVDGALAKVGDPYIQLLPLTDPAEAHRDFVQARLGGVDDAGSLHLLPVIPDTSSGDDDSDEDADSPYGQLGKWAEENRDASAVDVYKKADDLGIAKKHKAVQVLAQTLFDENVVEQITTFAPVFKKVHCSSMCRCSYSR